MDAERPTRPEIPVWSSGCISETHCQAWLAAVYSGVLSSIRKANRPEACFGHPHLTYQLNWGAFALFFLYPETNMGGRNSVSTPTFLRNTLGLWFLFKSFVSVQKSP